MRSIILFFLIAQIFSYSITKTEVDICVQNQCNVVKQLSNHSKQKSVPQMNIVVKLFRPLKNALNFTLTKRISHFRSVWE